MKPLIVLGGVALLAASALGLSVQGKLGNNPLDGLRRSPDVTTEFNNLFRQDFRSEANKSRDLVAITGLEPDAEIETFITELIEADLAPESIDLNIVFDTLQTNFPGAQYLAANLVSALNRDDLLKQLSSWDELIHPEFHEVSTAVAKSGRRLVAMSILSRRIPKFTVDHANRTGGRFFNKCPHCDSVHALDLDRKNKTLILSCPDCERPYDVLAGDAEGQMRRAFDFFTGFQVPITLGQQAPPKEQVLAIWNQIASRCSYEYDHSSFNESEVWKTSDATWLTKEGDCEDTAILLVDALISAGFDARVAIGWNGNIGQHAWVVLNLEGEQFVIESTIQENPTEADLVPVRDASPFYRPEQLFDRKHLYFQNAQPNEVALNYFSDDVWKSVAWNND